jgi:hypothetical protein
MRTPVSCNYLVGTKYPVQWKCSYHNHTDSTRCNSDGNNYCAGCYLRNYIKLTETQSITNGLCTFLNSNTILVNFSPKHFDHIITTCVLHANKSLHHVTSNYILVYEAYLLQQTDEISTNLHALYRPSTESITQTVCKIVIIREALRTLLYAQPKWDAAEKQD